MRCAPRSRCGGGTCGQRGPAMGRGPPSLTTPRTGPRQASPLGDRAAVRCRSRTPLGHQSRCASAGATPAHDERSQRPPKSSPKYPGRGW
eukprot:1233695-Alexandrium_andersonii.AAC.1